VWNVVLLSFVRTFRSRRIFWLLGCLSLLRVFRRLWNRGLLMAFRRLGRLPLFSIFQQLRNGRLLRVFRRLGCLPLFRIFKQLRDGRWNNQRRILLSKTSLYQ